MIGTLSGPRRPVVGTSRGIGRCAGSRACAPAATDRATPAPCLGLALAMGAALWVALGGVASLLAG